MFGEIVNALTFQSGYNATLVTLGAAMFGVAAGAAGTFLYFRKRALVSDAIAHATLPGVGIAFLVMVALGGDGRNLIVLLIGSAVSATLGLLTVDWIVRRTVLSEDAAIGAVLSVFFGIGVVLLTVIQTLSTGRQAGLEGFLLGSTAGMLFSDAVVIALGGALAIAVLLVLRRAMSIVSFDPEYAEATGINVQRIDVIMMMLVMAVTVIGLKLVGLILVVALLIIPPVCARFWVERTEHVVLIAAAVGGLSGYVGSALSASAPHLPTGPIIVLVCFALFSVSLLFAPNRGVVAALIRRRRFQVRVHKRQGLLALARGEPIFEPFTIKLLCREGFMRKDGVATEAGASLAAKMLRDEKRWEIARQLHQEEAVIANYDALTPIEDVLTVDEIAEIDRRLGGPFLVAGGI